MTSAVSWYPKDQKFKCSECGYAGDGWIEFMVECDVCGHHAAIQCTKCEEAFDLMDYNLEKMVVVDGGA